MKKLKLLLPLLCMGLVITGCGNKTIPKLENGKEVVATIDGKDFTAEELYAELKKQGGASVLVNMIDEFIVSQEFDDEEAALKYADGQIATLKAQYESYGEDFDAALKNAGYNKLSEFKDVIALDYKKNKVAEEYVKSTITEKEIKKYYDEKIFGDMTVNYILIKPETTDDMSSEEKTEAENKALEKAKDIIKKLKNGDDFEELAKKYSDDKSTSENGGLLTFSKDDVVSEFWDASVALKDGAYTTTPVKSSYGYFVISRVKQDEKPSLEDSEDSILEALMDKKFQDEANLSIKAWIEIRKKYNLDIIDSEVLDGYNKVINQYK